MYALYEGREKEAREPLREQVLALPVPGARQARILEAPRQTSAEAHHWHLGPVIKLLGAKILKTSTSGIKGNPTHPRT